MCSTVVAATRLNSTAQAEGLGIESARYAFQAQRAETHLGCYQRELRGVGCTIFSFAVRRSGSQVVTPGAAKLKIVHPTPAVPDP
jgi:hypothetical protein